MVTFTLHKTIINKNTAQLFIPLPRGLFQPIQRFNQFTNSSLIRRIITLRQTHIHIFINSAIQEGIINVKLKHRPIILNSKGNYTSHSYHFHYR
ncbi:hypothetical protein HanHA300_Chr15g0555881 [Helianthus annuus]|nr:hypothetical protein HanHA300_Chr15g0555881 [Helianthus annuus]KAJ0583183.1 hypothetical protein HanHA89_Chr05g0173761 [Helianthus annuus]KAJ0587004.1 hypothetical protein HanIR_Chr04g0158201 [Helianthus annuus]KAJ0624253.1 hypothetical protein HanIR_Chr01g0041131 [Helianthus annuus]